MKLEEKTFSRFNKFIIFWVIFLAFLNFLHSFLNILFNELMEKQTIFRESEAYLKLDTFIVLLIWPLSDYLTIMTLLYLFYFQGMQIRNKNLQQTQKKRKIIGENDKLIERSDRDTKDLQNILDGNYIEIEEKQDKDNI